MVSIVISIVTGMLLAVLAVLLGPTEGLQGYSWLIVAIPVGIVVLCPPVLNRLVNLGLRILKRDPLDDEMSWGEFPLFLVVAVRLACSGLPVMADADQPWNEWRFLHFLAGDGWIRARLDGRFPRVLCSRLALGCAK